MTCARLADDGVMLLVSSLLQQLTRNAIYSLNGISYQFSNGDVYSGNYSRNSPLFFTAVKAVRKRQRPRPKDMVGRQQALMGILLPLL